MFTEEQEMAIVNMVLANNAIRLREIRDHILNDATVFNNIDAVSLSTLQRVLQRHRLRMKQLYRVPFERNSDSQRSATRLCGCMYATLLPVLQTCRYRARVLDCTIFTDLYILLSVTENIGDGCSCNSP